jgi:hypothetical protein
LPQNTSNGSRSVLRKSAAICGFPMTSDNEGLCIRTVTIRHS